jgi:hypothetical protein|tara:strand:+ start:946 stop:1584 length:639 start_codon:yes stop_codon:yes gene_type:complete
MEEEMMNMQQSPTDQPIADATIESDGMLPAGLGDLAIDDPFNSPTPGESLTKTPEEKFPWEQASEYTEVRPFMEDLFLQLTEDKDRYVKLLVSFLQQVSIADTTQMLLYTSWRAGKINTDLMLLLIEPVMYLLIAMAEQAEIEPVIYDEENVDEPSQEDADLYVDESQKINEMKPEKIRKSSVEPSLLARVEDLPTAKEVGVTDNTQEEEVE